MKCPRCQYTGSRVVDSRPSDQGAKIRRRRECESCGYRFTTFEKVEESPLLVIKKNGTREEFNREKLLRGIRRAAEKRPISAETQENIVNEIERELRDQGIREVATTDLGERVMTDLAKIDDVAYIRFASVYREFKDISGFMDEMKQLQENKG